MGEVHDKQLEFYDPSDGEDERKNDSQNRSEEFPSSADDHPSWEVGLYIGTANIGFGSYFIFISSKPNDVRRLLGPGEHSTVYASQCPRENPPRFDQGVPYWLQSDGMQYAQAPDGAPVFLVSGPSHNIAVFNNENNTPSPVIRCSFVGPKGKYLLFQPIETHKLRLFNDRPFSIFKDQHIVAPRGDYLLKVRARRSGNGFFPVIERAGGICATLSRGDASRVVARDSPPADFVHHVCVARKAYLAIGCEDQARIPTISPGDLLLAGGVGNIKSRSQLIEFISSLLSAKYLNATQDGPLREGDDGAKLAKRVIYLNSSNRIHKDHCTLLWARQGEGLSARDARRLCLLLCGEDFMPQLIAPCNGSTAFAANADFFDVNPAMFPGNEFRFVTLVSGCVNVTNVLPNGRPSNIGSANVVRYAIGTAAEEPEEPWEATRMFPELLQDLEVDGVSPEGIHTEPDTEIEEMADTPASKLVICQARVASELKSILKNRRYVKTCELLRSSGGARWSTFLTLPSGNNPEEMDSLLKSRHFFQVSLKDYCRSSMFENGSATLLCGSKLAFLKDNPTALDLLALFDCNSENAPIIFPTGDFQFRILFKDHSSMPSFIEFLRDSNRALRANIFLFIRHGGVETRLTNRNATALRRSTNGPRRTVPSTQRGNFLTIAGLPVYGIGGTVNSILKWVSSSGDSTVKHFWAADDDCIHRFIIQIQEDLTGQLPDLYCWVRR